MWIMQEGQDAPREGDTSCLCASYKQTPTVHYQLPSLQEKLVKFGDIRIHQQIKCTYDTCTIFYILY